ncbi:uncharacterized protein LOC6612512 [Drosophila sechellia]|uniref:GM12690 n=1 Tax=Drosophila sechellia TaxID=7238 RepID=B4I0Z8_DROSE|nr:uncharacterized protein LOC6612512 [Drosophila sechellia]EDW53179.1 GM12690 [Drosophila sechellia]
MPVTKRSNTKQPSDYQQDLKDLYPVDGGNDLMTDWKDADRQLEDGMEELELVFNRLISPPLPGKGLPNDSRHNHRSNPIIHHFDDSPLPVAKGSCGPSNSNVIQNTVDNEKEIEELESEQADELEIDAGIRFLAIRFFNVLLAKLWRRRKAEVYDLQTLVRKYQAHAVRTRTELLSRNQLICTLQRRGQLLSNQLVQAVDRLRVTIDSCSALDIELKQVKERELELNNKLASKSLECEYVDEMLHSYRSGMFHELANYREGAAELAKQQRRALQLEYENAELEDALLTIKDKFIKQNDQMSVALGEKQRKLDAAYETLRYYEQELILLEIKYRETLSQTALEVELQEEVSSLKKKMSLTRRLIFYLAAFKGQTFHCCMYHVVDGILDCLAPAYSSPPMKDNFLRISMAALFLLNAKMY